MTTDGITLIVLFTLITLPYAVLAGDGGGPLARALGAALTVPWAALALAPIIAFSVHVARVHRAWMGSLSSSPTSP